MSKYHAFGLNIFSEIELPGIWKATDEDIDVKITLDELKLPVATEEGPNYLVYNDNVYLWWKDVGKVKISKGDHILVQIENEDENEMIPFLLGPVMALLLHQRGFLVLHGSSVRINNGAIAFLGHRGFGKSTTAINLYKRGYPLVADDILAIKFNEKGAPYVYPGYHHVRLSDDSYNNIKDSTDILSPIRTIAGKAFCDASYGYSTEPIQLEAIYILDKGDNIGISSLDSQRDMLNLLTHSTTHRIFSKEDQAKNFVRCANLINQIHIRRLETNHSFQDIDKIIQAVEKDIRTSK